MNDPGRVMIGNYTLAMLALLGSLLAGFIWAALLFMDGNIIAWQNADRIAIARDLGFTCTTFTLLSLSAFIPVRRLVIVRLALGSALMFFGAWHQLLTDFVTDIDHVYAAIGALALIAGPAIFANGIYHFSKAYRLSRLLLGSYRKIEHSLATTDQLTQLFNRRYFFSTCPALLANAQKHGEPVVLVQLMIENLPEINRQTSHAAGDCVLSEIGKLVARYTRRQDIAARVSGRSITLFLPETNRTAAADIADRLVSFSRQISIHPDGEEPMLQNIRLVYSLSEAQPEESFDQLVERSLGAH